MFEDKLITGTPEEKGKRLCELGVEHNEKWCDEITEGYRKQYEKEQQRTAKCQSQT